MARRKKKLTLEEEILQLEMEAEDCEEEIKKLNDRKQNLEQLIQQKQLEALHEAVKRSGRSITEAIALIEASSQEQQEQQTEEA